MDLPRHEKRHRVRTELWDIMHHSKGKAGQRFNFLLAVAIVISVGILPLEFLPGMEMYQHIFLWIEAVFTALFTVEYLLHIYAAPSRLRYIFSWHGIIDLLCIIPFYVGFFGFEYIRVLRLLRLVRIGEIEAAGSHDEDASLRTGIGLVEGESVEYVITRHPVFFLIGCIPPAIAVSFGIAVLLGFGGDMITITLSVAIFLFAFLFFIKSWLDYSYDVIYITTYRLIFHNQHILGRSINQVSFSSITNVKPSYPNVMSYLVGYGSLIIDTAAEHPGQIVLTTVRKHERAAQMIMQKSFVKR